MPERKRPAIQLKVTSKLIPQSDVRCVLRGRWSLTRARMRVSWSGTVDATGHDSEIAMTHTTMCSEFAGSPGANQAAVWLVQAYDYARDLEVDVWQFAIARDDLLAGGMSLPDLRWLSWKRFVEQAAEITRTGDTLRQFHPVGPTELGGETAVAFVLTPCGRELFRRIETPSRTPMAPLLELSRSAASPAEGGDDCPDRTSKSPGVHIEMPDETEKRLSATNGEDLLSPSRPLHPTVYERRSAPSPALLPGWNPQLRELWYDGQLVKRFRVPAENQELILGVFEEEGWPESIDDPLPPAAGIDCKRRLQATIKSLNRCQIVPALRFYGNGHGRSICWAAATAQRGPHWLERESDEESSG
jgi:hypothetical protein